MQFRTGEPFQPQGADKAGVAPHAGSLPIVAIPLAPDRSLQVTSPEMLACSRERGPEALKRRRPRFQAWRPKRRLPEAVPAPVQFFPHLPAADGPRIDLAQLIVRRRDRTPATMASAAHARCSE